MNRYVNLASFGLLAVLLVGLATWAEYGAAQDKKKDKDKKDKKKDDRDDHKKKDKNKDKDKDKKKDKDDKDEKHPLEPLNLPVGKLERQALVHYPKNKKQAAPVVLVFHGHGHTMRHAAESFDCHEHWPNAICVYLQGVPTVTPNDPKGKDAGWEVDVKKTDRDYLFVDRVLAALPAKHAIDEKRIFATGFSNGAYFAYGLWANRGKTLRAVAPCAGTLDRIGLDAPALKKVLVPKPCLHVAGRKDNKCKFEDQKEAVRVVREVNGCQGKGEDWPDHKNPFDGKRFPSTKNAPTVFLVHDGGHSVPDKAGKLIVEFFKEVSK